MRKETKKQADSETIFEQLKSNKKNANKILKMAKKQEKDKLKNGFGYVTSADGKTSTLKKL